jgi:hypothetical protein
MLFAKPEYLTQSYAAKRAQTTQNISTAGMALKATGAAVALIPVFPWTQIAGAGVALVGGALDVANMVRANEDRILTGDKKALASYMRKVARWSRAQRSAEAQKLMARRRDLKSKSLTSARRVELATLDMKLSILYQVESRGRSKPHEPVVPSDPQTAPVVAEQQAAYPTYVYVGAGAAVTAGILYLISRRQHA